MLPRRILLDTNIIIAGYKQPQSISGQLLTLLREGNVIIVVSAELLDQVRRVAKRVGGKDWAGFVLNRLWSDFVITFVSITEADRKQLPLNNSKRGYRYFSNGLEGKC